MRLLFDENLSPRLVHRLADLYPDSAHVHEIGFGAAADQAVWAHAAMHGFTITSKDADFHTLSFLRGQPPKVIWIRRGNCTTADVEALLRQQHALVLRLHADPHLAFLALA